MCVAIRDKHPVFFIETMQLNYLSEIQEGMLLDDGLQGS